MSIRRDWDVISDDSAPAERVDLFKGYVSLGYPKGGGPAAKAETDDVAKPETAQSVSQS